MVKVLIHEILHANQSRDEWNKMKKEEEGKKHYQGPTHSALDEKSWEIFRSKYHKECECCTSGKKP